jgi:hypothetical protein
MQEIDKNNDFVVGVSVFYGVILYCKTILIQYDNSI